MWSVIAVFGILFWIVASLIRGDRKRGFRNKAIFATTGTILIGISHSSALRTEKLIERERAMAVSDDRRPLNLCDLEKGETYRFIALVEDGLRRLAFARLENQYKEVWVDDKEIEPGRTYILTADCKLLSVPDAP